MGAATIKANAWEALIVASWPVSPALAAYGKLGVYRGAKATNYGGTWSFGAQFELNPRLARRGEWQSYVVLPAATWEREDVNVPSAGAPWRFR